MKKAVLKLCLFIAVGVTVSILNSCNKDDDNNDSNEPRELRINFSNPQAVLLKNNLTHRSAKSNLASYSLDDESTLFQINEKGEVKPVIEDVVITEVKLFSYGAIIRTNYGENYIVYLDNSYINFPHYIDYIGENEEGDLVFSDVSIMRKGSTEFEKIQTALNHPRAQSMSGNFVVISGENTVQAYNTVGGERFNIQGCNGPRLVALNSTRALLDDCHSLPIIDFKTGVRYEAELKGWNGEHIYLKDGALVMAQGLAPNFSELGIGIVDVNGNLEVVCNDGFNVGSTACMNCGNENSVLFASDDHYIVKELSQISVVKKGELNKKGVLSGYNILSISVKDDKVYFIAEDNLGNKKVGFYSLTTEEAIMIVTEEEFDSVYTF